MKRVRAGGQYHYAPVGLDLYDPIVTLPTGTLVTVIADRHVGRAPAPYAYVSSNGVFQGMVLRASLRSRKEFGSGE